MSENRTLATKAYQALIGFAEARRRGHDIEAIDLGQVRTGHAKQVGAQPELRRIPFLLLEPFLPLLLRQTSTLALLPSDPQDSARSV